jgi:hypothetical protein
MEREILSAFRWNRNEMRTWVLSSCLEGKMRNGGRWVGLPACAAAFAPRVVLLELYHTDDCKRAGREEGRRPSGIHVSSVLAALPCLAEPINRILTHPMPS